MNPAAEVLLSYLGGMLGFMFHERPSCHRGAVVWESDQPPGTVARILPDGCLDLMWLGGTLVVAGPDSRAHVMTVERRSRDTGLRFAPGIGAHLLGVPAVELRDQRVPLADLWPAARVGRVVDLVGAAADRGRALETVATELLAATDPPDPGLATVARLLAAGLPVAHTAERLGWGERRLHRRCQDAFGYGPKLLARVFRMRRALALARSGRPFVAVAGAAGYADQAHLAREVKALAGVPLGALVSRPAAR